MFRRDFLFCFNFLRDDPLPLRIDECVLADVAFVLVQTAERAADGAEGFRTVGRVVDRISQTGELPDLVADAVVGVAEPDLVPDEDDVAVAAGRRRNGHHADVKPLVLHEEGKRVGFREIGRVLGAVGVLHALHFAFPRKFENAAVDLEDERHHQHDHEENAARIGEFAAGFCVVDPVEEEREADDGEENKDVLDLLPECELFQTFERFFVHGKGCSFGIFDRVTVG